MTGKITIKEKAAVRARIGELNAHKTSVTALGTTVGAQITALTAALTATAGSDAEPVPSGISDAVQAEFNTAAEKVGTASGKLQSWLDKQTVIQEEGGTAVQGSGGDAPAKPETPKPAPAPTPPQVTPYRTSGGTTGGVSPYPAG